MNPEIKIYASGSSSLEIQAHLKESLAGKKLERTIYPLTFSEWLTQFSPTLPVIPSPETVSPIDDHEIFRHRLETYLRFGAMPGLITLENEIKKRVCFFGVYQTYLAKEIKAFLKDESVQAVNRMITYLALNIWWTAE